VNTPAAPTPLVALQDLRKRYNPGRPNEVEVLHGLALTLQPGEFAALIGPSGSGKSTLLNILGLLEPPSGGSYRLLGDEVAGLGDDALTALRRSVLGFVFQFHHLLPAFSALENVTLPALMRDGRVARAERERARDMLAAVGLAAAMDKRPGELSGGMQQRVAIARALSYRPKMLLMDEPFGALDALTRHHMQELLTRIWEKHRLTVLFITHDVEEAVYMSDRVAVMSNRPGRIKEIIDVDLERPRHYDMVASQRFQQLHRAVLDSIRAESIEVAQLGTALA
jgi:ABC-type nitrate/sulfonate/bicarbonate transport system, ATPase component